MIGKLDQRITIQRSTLTPDGIGGSTITWADYVKVWTQVTPKPLKAHETMVDDRMTATQIVWFTIYDRKDLTEKDRVVWYGRILNIRSIPITSTRSQFMDLICEAGITS